MNEIINNVWLLLNRKKYDKIIKECQVHDLKGGYGGSLNLKEIISLLIGSREEIKKLQKKIDLLETKKE